MNMHASTVLDISAPRAPAALADVGEEAEPILALIAEMNRAHAQTDSLTSENFDRDALKKAKAAESEAEGRALAAGAFHMRARKATEAIETKRLNSRVINKAIDAEREAENRVFACSPRTKAGAIMLLGVLADHVANILDQEDVACAIRNAISVIDA